MDVKTILAGTRPLLACEVEPRVHLIKSTFDSAFPEGLPTLDAFLADLPPELLGVHFGTNSFDGEIVRSLTLMHSVMAVEDVFKAAVLNQLVMQLTYQGRHIHNWRPPECAAFVGTDIGTVACAMLNASRILGFRIEGGGGTDEVFDEIVQLAAKHDLRIGATQARPTSEIFSVLEMENRDLGLVVLDGLDNFETFQRVLGAIGHRRGKTTFYAICDFAHRVCSAAAQLRLHHPHAHTAVRFYQLSRRPGESRGVLIVTGITEEASLELDLVVATRQAVTFVKANDLATPHETNGRIRSVLFGDPFRGGDPHHPAYERVVIKPPIMLRASGPLPSYSREIVERPVLVAHRAAIIKGGGVVHSRDPEHATYLYVSSAGEILSDIIETESFYRSPVFRNAIRVDDRLVSSTISRRHIRRIKGAAIPLCFAPNAHEYHSHFLLQCFPRVLVARELCKDATFLVPHDLRRYQLEMLHLVGVTDERIMPIEPEMTIYSDELFVPDLWPAIFNAYSSRIYDELIKAVVPGPRKPHRRIMISRAARQSWRNMVNFSSVSQVLVDEFGFEVVTPDKLSLREEIELFRDSQVIAGAEGAGLYNCCFASDRSSVLNIADQDYVMYIVGSMAQIRGFDLGYIFGESYLADMDLTRRGGHSDFVVDLALVRSGTRELLDKMLLK